MAEEQRVEAAENEDFAALLEQSMVKRQKLEPGQAVEAKIVKITDEWVFLDLGGKGEGCLDRKEVLDADGNVTVREGEAVRAYYLSAKNNDMLFTVRIGSGPAVRNQLEDAWRGGVPVDGAVMKEIKGGFEVKIGPVRAFCPFSQMGLRRGEDKSGCVGQTLSFKITEFSENGRNIVVSRRPVLQEERQAARAELQASLQEGMRVRGRVVSIQNFGAFVDIGGIEGLLPVSELSYSRVGKVSDVLSPGQEIEVVIKKLDWGADRFSLSLKDTLDDPWDQVEQRFPAGSFHRGTVNRLAGFGAFVNLAEGIDGLIHISRLGGGKRLNHPKEAVREGQAVEVKVESVDRANRKLSLSLADVSRAEEEAAATLKDFRQQQDSAPASFGSLGELLKAQMEKRKN